MGRSTRRGPWLPEEDATLLRLVHIQGPNNWVRISQHMVHRIPKQCRERYHQNLKPSLNHEPISAEEGEIIEQLVQEMGKRWAEIARRLGNRSDNAVKNWWNGSMNRRKRHNIQSPGSSRSVGFRPDPVPLTAPLRSPNYFAQFQTGNRTRYGQLSSHPETGISRLGGERFPPFDHRQDEYRRYLPGELQHKSPIPPPRLTLPELRSLPTLNQPLSAPGALQPTPDSLHSPPLHPASQSPPVGRPPSLETRSSCPSEWQLPRIHYVETSAISPAASDYSNAPSLQQAPSLVSDNQSHFSISPKTVTSPRLPLPASTEAQTKTWHVHQRTPSYWAVGSQDGRTYHDEGYVSAVLPAPRLDSTGRRCPSESLHNSNMPPRPAVQQPSPLTPRDARMTVSRLLD